MAKRFVTVEEGDMMAHTHTVVTAAAAQLMLQVGGHGVPNPKHNRMSKK